MTLTNIRKRVEEIRECSSDDEMAHSMEDRLHFELLQFIAASESSHAALAREALRTADIRFARWCA